VAYVRTSSGPRSIAGVHHIKVAQRARAPRGLFDVANQLGQQTLSALVALVHQPLQLLEVAAFCGQLGQPIRSLLVTIIGQPTQY
jgi:hypothetical protein